MAQTWTSERKLCRVSGARQIDMPANGDKSETVSLLDVLERRVYFPAPGVFVIWDGIVPVYISSTTMPIAVRLRTAIANHAMWSRVDYRDFKISMQRGSEGDALRLRYRLDPKFNRRGYTVGRSSVRETVADWLDGEVARLSTSGQIAAAEAVSNVKARLLKTGE